MSGRREKSALSKTVKSAQRNTSLRGCLEKQAGLCAVPAQQQCAGGAAGGATRSPEKQVNSCN